MPDASADQRNAFTETMLGLEYASVPADRVDLFSTACAEQFRDRDLTRFGYLFAQVFDANVLAEVAELTGVPYESVAELRHRPTAAMTLLADLTSDADKLSVVELINVAAALISVSRFGQASRLLALATARAKVGRESFEAWMLAFVVANRCDDQPGSAQAFTRMRQAIELRSIPPERVLDACSLAVVWYLKRKELPEAAYQWYLSTGQALAGERANVDPAALSSWYRALAMVPAAAGDAETARQTLAQRPRAYEMHLLKTYHESSLKEHMFVTGDFDRAEESGRALIALDPAWAPSYGELAEAYLRFGRPEQAATMYEKAIQAGPPYYCHHLLGAARAREKSGDNDRAIAHYEALSRLVPDNVAVAEAGLDLARKLSHASQAHFAKLLEQPSPAQVG